MKILLWIMGICVILNVVLVLWEKYKYPVCPECHDNLRSKRVNGKIVCSIHGVVCILLFFCIVGHGNAQEFFEFRKKFSKNLPAHHVLVKLAQDVDIYLVTVPDGCHIYMIAEGLGIDPIIPNRKYSGHAVAFPRNSSGLQELAEFLDKDGDGVITLDELSEIY